MERKENNGKVIAIIALFVAVMGLSIGFAALFTELSITGTATVTGTSGGDVWNVKFKELTKTLTGATEASAAVLDDTSITFNLKFTKPGDKAEYKFKVENTGMINAILNTYNAGKVTCATVDSDAAKTKKICDLIKYELKYDTTDTTKAGQAVAQNDTLDSKQSRPLVLTVTFDEGKTLTAADLTEDDVVTDSITISFNYGQAD